MTTDFMSFSDSYRGDDVVSLPLPVDIDSSLVVVVDGVYPLEDVSPT